MTRHNKIAAVFGGTGFLGKQVVRELAKAGFRVKVITRVPERAYGLKPCGNVGQITACRCDYKDQNSLNAALKGVDVVINTIGVLFEKRRGDFERAHVSIPEAIASACKDGKIKQFIHVSALGVGEAQSKYAQSKLKGEQRVQEIFPNAVIMRPSVIFGPEDDFLNMFAEMARFMPFLPLIGGGKTRFQPVFVGDVADAIMKAVALPATGEHSASAKIYELGGPEILTFKEIYEKIFEHTGRTRTLMNVPFWMAKFKGNLFTFSFKVFGIITGYMPRPPLTADQVESLKTDTVVADDANTLKDLNVSPTSMDAILPKYLKRFQPGGRFGGKQMA